MREVLVIVYRVDTSFFYQLHQLSYFIAGHHFPNHVMPSLLLPPPGTRASIITTAPSHPSIAPTHVHTGKARGPKDHHVVLAGCHCCDRLWLCV